VNNLIVTIIAIALTAIGLITGAYYGGVAYENAQINATANTIMNEAQQILQAERMWATNNNQPDISGMGTAGASGTGMSALVNGKELSEWPSFGGTMGTSASPSLTNPGPQPTFGSQTVTTSTYDDGCYNIRGYAGPFRRIPFSYNNGNYVLYEFDGNFPYAPPCNSYNGLFVTAITDVSQINHPIVKIAKAINAALNQIPTNANTASMAYIGLPYQPIGSTPATGTWDTSTYFASPQGNYSRIWLDPNGTLQSNYCYLENLATVTVHGIFCVFGPS